MFHMLSVPQPHFSLLGLSFKHCSIAVQEIFPQQTPPNDKDFLFFHINETANTVKICTANKDYSCRLFTDDSNSHKTLKLAANPQHHARKTDWLSVTK